VNDYYSVDLKNRRLEVLKARPGFRFVQLDLCNVAELNTLLPDVTINKVIHLAAQAGVRYSLINPQAYIRSNVEGFVSILEYCRRLPSLEGVVYASSSSVYGGNTKLPFAESDRVDTPLSLYAASKKSNEEMGYVYSHLFGLPMTGLRFFTVYGPWGRPDMAMWIFTQAILAGNPIPVYNNGVMRRNFTFVEDIISGVVAVSDSPPQRGEGAPHRVYNLGNDRAEDLLKMISLLEKNLQKTAKLDLLPLQPGDVPETLADISKISQEHGFYPTTPIEDGIPQFVDWYRWYTA
jgi:UDP-glucuronate 4-epimerase